MQRHSTILFVILSLLLVILFVLDLLIGSVHIPLRDILGALFGGDVDASCGQLRRKREKAQMRGEDQK